jgi:hypothetical protein
VIACNRTFSKLVKVDGSVSLLVNTQLVALRLKAAADVPSGTATAVHHDTIIAR